METIYLESSVISYLCSSFSENIRILNHQLITKEWWEKQKHNYQFFISLSVKDEIALGNPLLAKKRLNFIRDIPVLEYHNDIGNLISQYMTYFKLPKNIQLDITHISYAVYYNLDFLVSWNCKHIANAHFRHQLSKYNIKQGLAVPDLCTPEALFEWKENKND